MAAKRRTLLPTTTTRLSRADKGADRVIRFTASTENVARDGGIVEAAGWEVDNYRDVHPVFLWAHSPDSLPLGRAVNVEKTKDSLVIDIEFAGEAQAHPLAETVFRLFDAGFLRCVSVGFRVIKERDPTDEERERGAKWVATRAELLELSAVPVPSDPGAVATGREIATAISRGAITTKDAATIRHHLGAITPWSAFADAVERTAMTTRNIEEGEAAFTIKVRDAADFAEDSFAEAAYQEEPMVVAVTGMLTEGEKVVVQGLAFPKDEWDEEAVATWWSENEDNVLAFEAERADDEDEDEEAPSDSDMSDEEKPEAESKDAPQTDDEEDEEDDRSDELRVLGASLRDLAAQLVETADRLAPEEDADEAEEPERKDQLAEDSQRSRPADPVGDAERDAPAAAPVDEDQYRNLLDLTSQYVGD